MTGCATCTDRPLGEREAAKGEGPGMREHPTGAKPGRDRCLGWAACVAPALPGLPPESPCPCSWGWCGGGGGRCPGAGARRGMRGRRFVVAPQGPVLEGTFFWRPLLRFTIGGGSACRGLASARSAGTAADPPGGPSQGCTGARRGGLPAGSWRQGAAPLAQLLPHSERRSGRAGCCLVSLGRGGLQAAQWLLPFESGSERAGSWLLPTETESVRSGWRLEAQPAVWQGKGRGQARP